MSAKPHLVRGAVLKCLFPFEEHPSKPGLAPHYCLFVDNLELNGVQYIAAAYGTSRLDQKVLNVHHVLDVSTGLIQGSEIGQNQGVIHFLCDHIAVMPFTEDWIYMNFSARLAAFKAEHQKDPHRRNLLKNFNRMELTMVSNAIDAIHNMRVTGQPGLPATCKLR